MLPDRESKAYEVEKGPIRKGPFLLREVKLYMLWIIVYLTLLAGSGGLWGDQLSSIDSCPGGESRLAVGDVLDFKRGALESRKGNYSFGDSLNCKVVGGWFRGPNYDVFIADTLAYIGDGRYLDILNVKSTCAPVLIGRALTSSVVRGVCVSGDYAYVADEVAGLCIIDVSDPGFPQIVGYSPGYFATRVWVVDTLAYLADGGAGVKVIDISNPSSPVEIGRYVSKPAWDLYLLGHYAYVTSWDRGLTVIDVSNPASPQEVGHCLTGGYAYGVFISKGYAYVADQTRGVCVLDISDPEDPVLIGSHNLLTGSELTIFVSGKYAYVATSKGELGVIDLVDPGHLVGSLNTRGRAFGLYVLGSYVYLADGNKGLRIIDVSDPTSLTELGCYDTPGFAQRVYVSDNLAYVTDYYDGGFRIIDVSDPESVKQVGYFDAEDNLSASGIYVADSLAYLGTEGWLRIVNISDPAHPKQVGFCRTQQEMYDLIKNVWVAGDYAYVANGYGGFKVVKISDPEHPFVVGMAGVDPFDIYVAGNYAYVANYGYTFHHDGLKVVDVSNPEDMDLPIIGSLETGSSTASIYVLGNRAFLTDYDRGLVTVDISDPHHPKELTRLSLEGRAEDVYVPDGKYAYIADGSAGLRIIDVSRPMLPSFEVGYYETGGYASAVFVSEKHIYIADGSAGLYILESPYLGVEEKMVEEHPVSFILSQNYPNPFNAITVISYAVPSTGQLSADGGRAWVVELRVHNITGQLVRTLVNESQGPGVYSVSWDGRDAQGQDVGSGVYFYRLKVKGDRLKVSEMRKMILLR